MDLKEMGEYMMIPSGTGVLEKQSSGPRGGSDLQEEAPDQGKAELSLRQAKSTKPLGWFGLSPCLPQTTVKS